MNIFIRAISYDAPQDDYPSGGVVEFQDDVNEDLSLEEYGRDAWAFLEGEIGAVINGFEASFQDDFKSSAYRYEKTEDGGGFIIYDISDDASE